MRLLMIDHTAGTTAAACWLLFSAACLAAPSAIQRFSNRGQR